jgi:hypothetical protein
MISHTEWTGRGFGESFVTCGVTRLRRTQSCGLNLRAVEPITRHVCSLPRRLRSAKDFFDAHDCNLSFELFAISPVRDISVHCRRERPRRFVEPSTLQSMSRDIEMGDSPAVMCNDDKNEQNLEPDGMNREEVYRSELTRDCPASRVHYGFEVLPKNTFIRSSVHCTRSRFRERFGKIHWFDLSSGCFMNLRNRTCLPTIAAQNAAISKMISHSMEVTYE